ncbi:protein recA [Candidatus Moduliflexus flocculans]|uniref:Protein RecA n=1 Tax=Candidatus Moduliflexus flocculans TaxID=1499966 RepID=A0A081BSP3_9BACT|nr:protein recA [Candidatus Moduliflexus flocculans]
MAAATTGNSDFEKRQKMLDVAISQIIKQHGKGAIMKLGAEGVIIDIPAISTGCLSLDLATGVGGVPRGRIVEIFGTESSGKTTLALHISAEAQKKDGIVAFIDAEHALDAKYARKLGVNTDELLISQPDTGEQALEIADTLVHSGAVDVIVIDSVAALVPKNEIEGEMGDAPMGQQARLMSQAMRKLAGVVSKTRTTLIFINQLRDKLGVMFGSPETTTGGRALKFYSSMRIDIRRTNSIKQGQDVIGNRTKVKIVKNKVAPPFKECEFDIIYGEGISREGDVLDLAVNYNVIRKSGAWYSYEDERIGQGRENVKDYLKEHPDILEAVRNKVIELVGMHEAPPVKLPSEAIEDDPDIEDELVEDDDMPDDDAV